MPLFLSFIILNNHSYNTIIHPIILRHLPRSVFLYLHRTTQQENQTRACLTASRRTTNRAAPHPAELLKLNLNFGDPFP